MKASINMQDSGIEEYVLLGGSVPKHAVEILRDEYFSREDTSTDISSSSSEFSETYLYPDRNDILTLKRKLCQALKSTIFGKK